MSALSYCFRVLIGGRPRGVAPCPHKGLRPLTLPRD
nr:MAG TPA: hypothetical protein [Caudoviricetes sp.]